MLRNACRRSFATRHNDNRTLTFLLASPIFETLGKCPLYLDSKAMASELYTQRQFVRDDKCSLYLYFAIPD